MAETPAFMPFYQDTGEMAAGWQGGPAKPPPPGGLVEYNPAGEYVMWQEAGQRRRNAEHAEELNRPDVVPPGSYGPAADYARYANAGRSRVAQPVAQSVEAEREPSDSFFRAHGLFL